MIERGERESVRERERGREGEREREKERESEIGPEQCAHVNERVVQRHPKCIAHNCLQSHAKTLYSQLEEEMFWEAVERGTFLQPSKKRSKHQNERIRERIRKVRGKC
jgi:hypothetical protein